MTFTDEKLPAIAPLTRADLEEVVTRVVNKAIDERVPVIVTSIVNRAIEEKVPPIVQGIVDKAIENLAMMTANGFREVHEKIDGIENRFDALESMIDSKYISKASFLDRLSQ